MGHLNEAILIIQFEAIVGKFIIALNILDEFKIMELKGRVAHNENQPNYRCCLFFSPTLASSFINTNYVLTFLLDY